MLSEIQKRIERTLFEAIRKVLVAEGYLPDITATSGIPPANVYGSSPYSVANQTAWDSAVSNVVNSKGMAVEVFSNSVNKGLKKVPRIVIIPRRTMPGDIGAPPQLYYGSKVPVLDHLAGRMLPLEASHYYMDVHLISGSATEDRVLNAVLSKALGNKKYLEYYDEAGEYIFLKQYNYYDLPDPIEGQQERIYAYEIPDVYDVIESYVSTPVILEITTELLSLFPSENFKNTLPALGTYFQDGNLVIDLSGYTFN